jgi:hypothetical protein
MLGGVHVLFCEFVTYKTTAVFRFWKVVCSEPFPEPIFS